jgi:hypothetical protein
MIFIAAGAIVESFFFSIQARQIKKPQKNCTSLFHCLEIFLQRVKVEIVSK